MQSHRRSPTHRRQCGEDKPLNYESIKAAEYDAEYGWCSMFQPMEVDTVAFGDLNTGAFGDLNTDAFGDLAGVYIEVDRAIFHTFASTHLHTLGSKQTHLDLPGW